MERELRIAGIDSYEFVEAVDGSVLDLSALERYQEDVATRANGERMLPGEVACALSHIGIYERMLDEGMSHCLILEDDIVLPKGFLAVATRIAEEERGSDVITFNYPPVQVLHPFPWKSIVRAPHRVLYYLLKIPYNAVLKTYELMLNSLFRTHPRAFLLPRPLYLAGAYIVTIDGARKLLSLTRPIRYTADKLLNRARVMSIRPLGVKACIPLLVQQDQDNYGSDMNYDQRI